MIDVFSSTVTVSQHVSDSIIIITEPQGYQAILKVLKSFGIVKSVFKTFFLPVYSMFSFAKMYMIKY